MKNKHADDEDAMEADGHEVKRLKFDNDEEEDEEEERESSCPARPESSTDTPESSTDAEVEQGNPANVVTGEDHSK